MDGISQLEKYIDHTLLKSDATAYDIAKLCDEAIKYGFRSVCINPCFVKHAAKKLKNSGVEVCTVVGFPLGANETCVKAYEAMCAVINGATEVDMVINVGALKSGDYEYVKNDIISVVQEVNKVALERDKCSEGYINSNNKITVKVIIECSILTDEQKKVACMIALDTGVDFIKTSTGFSIGKALISDIHLIKEIVGGKMKIKASAGIRDYNRAVEMIEAGADRLGTSASLDIIKRV